MSEIARMWATVGADASSFRKEMDGVSDRVNGFKSIVGGMQTATIAAFAAIGAAVAGAGIAVAKTGIDFLAMKEQANIAFTTMLGSGAQAKVFLDDLQDFAAKTPFEFPDLVRASQRLLAMGFAAHEIRPTLTAVGDAVAGLGGGSVEIDRVTTALGQMNAKGKASAEEMMQLTEAGIPAWQMLADKIGVTVPEAMKLVTKGAVTADTAISAVVAGMNERFGGMMEAQSKTWNGLLSTLKDVFGQISGTVMKPFFDFAKVGLEKLVAGMTAFQEVLQRTKSPFQALQAALEAMLPPELFARWNTLREQITAAIEVVRGIVKPITDAIAKFLSWKDVAVTLGIIIASVFAGMISSMMPIIATFALITAAVAGLRWAWESDLGGIRTFTLNTVNKISDWFFKESGIWKGTWQDTGAYILDRVRYFFEIAIPYAINGFTSGAKFHFQQWFIWARDNWNAFVEKTKQIVEHWASVIGYHIRHTKDLAIQHFNEWLGPTLKKITDWVTVTKSKFDNWVQHWTDKARQWKEDMIERFQPVFDWWDRHIQPFVDKGKAIMQGLWDGAKEVWNRFADWWRGLWQKLTGTVDVKLKIGSPSKEMFERGANTIKGFALGAQSAMPLAMDAMSGLATGAMSAGQYAYAGAPSSSSSQPTTSTARIEQLLEILIAELRNKNMSVNINGGGGGLDYGSMVAFKAGTH